MTNEIFEFVTSVYNYINNKIDKIYDDGTLQDIDEILVYINDFSNKNIIYEELINKYLLEIKKTDMNILIGNIDKNIDDTFSFFYGNDEKCIFAGNNLANDMINKIYKTDSKNIKSLKKVEYIKKYCINNNISNIDIVIIWIIVKLACIDRFLKIK